MEENLYDISGLDPQSSREQIRQVLISLKTTQQQRKEKEKDLALWTHRVELAQKAGKPELAQEAQNKAQDLQNQIQGLLGEEKELEKGIDIMKGQLPGLDAQGELTIDPEALLAQLENLTGPSDSPAEALKDTEAEAALAELKKKMGL